VLISVSAIRHNSWGHHEFIEVVRGFEGKLRLLRRGPHDKTVPGEERTQSFQECSRRSCTMHKNMLGRHRCTTATNRRLLLYILDFRNSLFHLP
jgi:hypothetical protein